MSQATTSSQKLGNYSDAQYHRLVQAMQDAFLDNIEDQPLFTTDLDDLWEVYLESFADPVTKQYHNCSACRHFIQRFGHLVTIDEDGNQRPAMWDVSDDHPYAAVFERMTSRIRTARVTGIHLSSEPVWGQPETGVWKHFAVVPPTARLHRSALLTAGQAMAEKREDYKNVKRALSEFDLPLLEKALGLLKSESLYRSEKVIGPVQWLHDLHVARENVGKNKALRRNVTWLAIATAPKGFLHTRAGMAGTLLDDLASGMDFAQVSKRFADKMHPLSYQRPQVAPSAGNIKVAEEIVAKLGLAPALQRRFAKLEEIKTTWVPPSVAKKDKGDGVFGHLTPKGHVEEKELRVTKATSMTWDKFTRTILPDVLEMQVYIGQGAQHFGAIVTAVNPEAPPLLQWDYDDARNPFSWYLWNGGSMARQWNLESSTFHKINAVCWAPSHWNAERAPKNQPQGIFLIIDGARETRNAGLALFPEILRSELHGIRSTIEAFSNKGKLEGMEEASACGLILQQGAPLNVRLRVRTKALVADYTIDRID